MEGTLYWVTLYFLSVCLLYYIDIISYVIGSTCTYNLQSCILYQKVKSREATYRKYLVGTCGGPSMYRPDYSEAEQIVRKH